MEENGKKARFVIIGRPRTSGTHFSALSTMGARLMAGLTFSVAEMLGRPGNFRDLRLTEPLDGVATALARLDPPAIEADLRAEAVVEGILVTGRVQGAGVLTCARCLKQFPAGVEVEVCELFETPERQQGDDSEDSYPIEGTEIKLEPMLRDVVALALPLNPHCSDDCHGLCANCGKELIDGDCDCIEDERDPRWAGLEALKDKLA